MNPLRLAIAILVLWAGAAAAQRPTPVTPPFVVAVMPGQPYGPGADASMAPNPSSGFLVVWLERGTGRLQGRAFGSNGVPQADAFDVATNASGRPHVDRSSSGEFVVTWTVYLPRSVRARAFDASATPLASDFEVSPNGPLSQYPPAAAMQPDSRRFVVVWNAFDEYAVVAHRFDEAGMPEGKPITVAGNIDGNKGTHTDVGRNASGSFVVAWTEQVPVEGPGSDRKHVFAQRYDSSGNLEGQVLDIETGAIDSDSLEQSVALAPDGSLVLAWTGQGSLEDIFVQKFGPNGSPIGPGFQSDRRVESQPKVMLYPDGRYIVFWHSSSSGGLQEFRCQLFATSGQPLGPELLIADSDEDGPNAPLDVTAHGSDLFTTVWLVRPADSPPTLFARTYQLPAPMAGPSGRLRHIGSFTAVSRA